MSVQFIIHHKITSEDSTNKIYASRSHWHRKKKVDYFKSLAKIEMARQLPKRKPFDVPVIIEFKFRSKLDISNCSFMVKIIEDSMKGVLIVNDSQKYVKGIVMLAQEDDDVEGDIIVTVREV